jgi:hypothetical protein
MDSPKAETARRQPKIKTPSRGVEGEHLARATAYVQERLGKRHLTCDAFYQQAQGEVLLRVEEAGIEQHRAIAVNKRKMNETEYLPHKITGPTLPALPFARPMRANPYYKLFNEPKAPHKDHHDFPSTSVSPISPNNDIALNKIACQFGSRSTRDRKDEGLLNEADEEVERQDQEAVNTMTMSICRSSPKASEAVPASTLEQSSYRDVRKMDEATLTPCSNRAKLSALSTPGSPASPNNDLTHNKADLWLDSSPPEKAQEDEEELLIEATEGHECLDRCSPPKGDLCKMGLLNTADVKRLVQEAISGLTTNITTCSYYVVETPLPHAVMPVLCPKDACQRLKSKHDSLVVKRLEEEKWPDQDAISKTKDSACLHWQESAVALPLPTPERISQLPAYLLPSSPAPKNWLHRKPPDHGKDTRQQLGRSLALWLVATYLACRRLLAFISHCGSRLAIFDS